jgi:hypothetical protein
VTPVELEKILKKAAQTANLVKLENIVMLSVASANHVKKNSHAIAQIQMLPNVVDVKKVKHPL